MKLTVGQYQQLYAIAKSEDSFEEKAIQSISVVTGKTIDEVMRFIKATGEDKIE